MLQGTHPEPVPLLRTETKCHSRLPTDKANNILVYLCVKALQQIDHLARVYPSSHPMTPGIGSNPQNPSNLYSKLYFSLPFGDLNITSTFVKFPKIATCLLPLRFMHTAH